LRFRVFCAERRTTFRQSMDPRDKPAGDVIGGRLILRARACSQGIEA
jgi:hypothetical protein